MEQNDPFFIEHEDLKIAIQVLNGDHEIQTAFIDALNRSDEIMIQSAIIYKKMRTELNMEPVDDFKLHEYIEQKRSLHLELLEINDRLRHLSICATMCGYPKMLHQIYHDYMLKK